MRKNTGLAKKLEKVVLEIIRTAYHRGEFMSKNGYANPYYPDVDQEENYIKICPELHDDIDKLQDKIQALEEYLNIRLGDKEYKKEKK